MIKVMACIMVISATTIAGFLWGEALKKRTVQLKELQRCLYHLQNEVIYTHTHLIEAFHDVSLKSETPIGKLFEDISKILYKGEAANVLQVFMEALEINSKELYINDDDKKMLLNFSRNLGEADLEGEKKIFTLTLENLKLHVNSATDKMEKNIKMYRALGFTAGTMIAILFV